MPETKVKLLIGANAYACITESGVAFDVKLAPGKSAESALREYASEQRERAQSLIANAEMAERAALVLYREKA